MKSSMRIRRESAVPKPPVLIYLSHAFGGKKENVDHVAKQIQALYRDHICSTAIRYHNAVFVSPIHALGFIYDLVPYDQGLDNCIELLKHCQLMITFRGYDESVGVKAEKAYCQAHGIPVIDYDEFRFNLRRGSIL